MKRNSSLLLLELTVMLLVFAAASALCVSLFFRADSLGRESAAADSALIMAENAAEVLKSCSGDFGRAAEIHGGTAGDTWILRYGEDGSVSPDGDAYRLEAVGEESKLSGLGKARITVYGDDGAALVSLTVAWQEVRDE